MENQVTDTQAKAKEKFFKYLEENHINIFGDEIRLAIFIHGFDLEIYTIPSKFEEDFLESLIATGMKLEEMPSDEFKKFIADINIPVLKYSVLLNTKSEKFYFSMDSGGYYSSDVENEKLEKFIELVSKFNEIMVHEIIEKESEWAQ